MNKDLTELVFILDKSGSMAGLEEDTIGGFNSLLAKQKKHEGQALITTVLFDNNYEVLHSRAAIQTVNPITSDEYYVEGSTALLDAIGRTIEKIGRAVGKMPEAERPGQVMFTIITDGMENASRRYSYGKIKEMIEHRKAEFGWEFIFLGANIDAIASAAQIGIGPKFSARYNSDAIGTGLNFSSVNDAIYEMRENSAIPDDWKKDIDDDFKKRGKK